MPKGTCSFCNKKDRTIKRMAKKSQICDECVYRATIAIDETGKYHLGQIICKGCKGWKSIRLHAQGGGYVTFKGWELTSNEEGIEVMVDQRGMTVYTLGTATDGVSSEKKILKAMQCVTCSKSLPNWYLDHNTYLQQYFKHDPTIEQKNPTP